MVLGGTATISTQILREKSCEVVIGGAHLGLVVYVCPVLSSVLDNIYPNPCYKELQRQAVKHVCLPVEKMLWL